LLQPKNRKRIEKQFAQAVKRITGPHFCTARNTSPFVLSFFMPVVSLRIRNLLTDWHNFPLPVSESG
jgi:hypothetical protein